MANCPYCGQYLREDQIYCIHCGRFIDAARTEESAAGETSFPPPPPLQLAPPPPPVQPPPQNPPPSLQVHTAAPPILAPFPPAYAPQNRAAKKQKNWRAGLVISGVMALGLAAAIFLGLLLPRRSSLMRPDAGAFGIEAAAEIGASQISGTYVSSYETDSGPLFFAVDGGEPIAYDRNSYCGYQLAQDGSRCYFLQADATGDEALYVTDFDAPPQLLVAGVYRFTLCAGGAYIYYVDRTMSYNNGFWRYEVASGDRVFVAQNVQSYAISPDGSRALYTDGDTIYSIIPGQEPVRLATGASPQAYAIADDGSLCVYNEEKSSAGNTLHFVFAALEANETLAFSGYGAALFLNRTADDALFLCEDGLFRCTAGTLAKLDDNDKYNLIPLLSTQLMASSANGRIDTGVYDHGSFSSFYYLSDGSAYAVPESRGGLYYKNENGEVELVHDGVAVYAGGCLAGAGESVFFSGRIGDSYSALLRATRAANGAHLVEAIAPSALSFSAAPDGKTVFYTANSEDPVLGRAQSLLCWRQGGEIETIARDVETFFIGGPNGTYCTYVTGGAGNGNHDLETGAAYLYTPQGGSTLVAEAVWLMAPPSAAGSFYYLMNPREAPEGGYWPLADIFVYQGGESRLIIADAEYNRWNRLEAEWFRLMAHFRDPA